jgi:hypothetical protein
MTVLVGAAVAVAVGLVLVAGLLAVVVAASRRAARAAASMRAEWGAGLAAVRSQGRGLARRGGRHRRPPARPTG